MSTVARPGETEEPDEETAEESLPSDAELVAGSPEGEEQWEHAGEIGEE